MRHLLHTALSALAFATCAAAEPAAVAGQELAIARWNNCLVVTAPETRVDTRLAAGLSQRITFDAREQPLAEVVTLLRKMTTANWVIDPPLMLADAPTVTLQVKEMELGMVIRWIERTAAVTIAPVDSVWYVTRRPLPGRSVTRVYDVSDLTMDIQDFPGLELALSAASQNGAALFDVQPKPESKRPSIDEIEEFVREQILRQK